MKITPDLLIKACADDAFDAGLTIRSQLEPLAGPGAPVKPATYEGGRYQEDKRWVGEGDSRRPVDAVVIDNVPSQANRLEAALERHVAALGLPMLVLDLSAIATLPVHLPRRLSSFMFPHRNGDAYLRDALIDGVDFAKSAVGSSVLLATPDAPDGLFQWMPQALLYGFWLSHMGKKRQQTKLARSWVSEIVGYAPATTETKVLGLKGDALNLSIDDALEYNDDDQLSWRLIDAAKQGRKSKDSLAEIGHGQVPVGGASPAGVSFEWIEQRSTLSIASLRRISCGTAGKSAAGRTLLAAIGIAGHVLAFGRSVSLRSGCDLKRIGTQSTWLGAETDESVELLTPAEAIALVAVCAERAEGAGLPVGGKWSKEPLVLTPNEQLRKVIEKTWPLGDQ